MTREGRTRRAWVGKFILILVQAIILTSCFVHRLEEFLVRAGFDAPDAAVERGYVYFEDVESAAATAGVERARTEVNAGTKELTAFSPNPVTYGEVC